MNPFDNIDTILGYGFLGLSFLFVYLAYTNIREVIKDDKPTEAAVNLSKFFMIGAMLFMIIAAPLQIAMIYVNSQVTEKKIKLTITMPQPAWDDTLGQVVLLHKGQQVPIINRQHTGEYREDDTVVLNAAKVHNIIRTIRAQLAALNAARNMPVQPAIGPPEAPVSSQTLEMLQGG
ncbi:hypothetical protein [Pseudovibrio sp. Tun.PSC04-5.I4]|uniref:hypothetical protein n=1 Tax=Pseudovibrio sp. Tun.PSC04-5.I4 TaxID=1798213 RepID=UPI0008804215|nr:hypothetical protein [Pseudovibrio sp. Tun.PSC04-5.I4]SDR37925.1 hypothetical protein SAMN04515695_5141 [Pseudovibrio sp. Tun.PSC04-5.I4]